MIECGTCGGEIGITPNEELAHENERLSERARKLEAEHTSLVADLVRARAGISDDPRAWREQFRWQTAAIIAQGLACNMSLDATRRVIEMVAKDSLRLADALIAELQRA